MSSFAALLFAVVASAQSLDVGTFAGGTTGGGYIDAIGTDARFSVPRGIASDAEGNLYIADTGNHVIRKVMPTGEVTTLAGLANVEGFSDGSGGTARFRYPAGVAVDPVSGNIYVADKDNHAIRKITPGGNVTTIAGLGGSSGTANGTGTTARFTFPRGLTLDNMGVIYVADASNSVIRKITPTGEVTTFAGIMRVAGGNDGFPGQATFTTPYDIALDPTTGNFYVSDGTNDTIRKVTPEGRVTTVAGNPSASGDEDGLGTDALFDIPWGIDVDAAGNVYVADTGNQKIRKITPAGMVTTFAGRGFTGTTNGGPTVARFNSPSGLTLGLAAGLFVTDGYNAVVRRVSASGDVSTFVGSMPSNGVTDGASAAARFHFPNAPALDSAGNAYITDSNCTIRKITPQGVVSTLAGTPAQCGAIDGTGANARFDAPTGIGVGPDGNIYVADGGNNTIRKITPQGVVTTLAGNPNDDDPLFQDGSGSQARFNFPYGLAIDSHGLIYVADLYNHRIRLVEPTGVVTTFAGNGISSHGDGIGTSAYFDFPMAIAIDTARNLYVAEWGNNTIRKITQTGVVTTIAGLPGIPGNVNGKGTAARFTFLEGLAVTGSGKLLIADTFNHTIRVGSFAEPTIDTFAATPRSIQPGQSSTLQWVVRDSTSVTITGIGGVAPTGSTLVTPQVTTTYTLTAAGPGGTTSKQVTVFVGGGKRRAARK